jgi:hypothetical protein
MSSIKQYVKAMRDKEATVESLCTALFAEGGAILNRPWASRPSVEKILQGQDQKFRAVIRRLNNPNLNPEAFCDFVNAMQTKAKGEAQ